MGLTVTVEDQATPWLQWAMKEFPNLRKRALKSAGYFGQKKIKEHIKSGAPGGRPYAKGMSVKRRRKLEKKKGGKFSPLGKLRNAIGYQYIDAEESVVIGWLSASAAKLGRMHEGGGSWKVTPLMKLKYFSTGIGITKDTIDIPARPTIEPMAKFLYSKWAPHIEAQMWKYLSGKQINIKPAKRKYVVKGAW